MTEVIAEKQIALLQQISRETQIKPKQVQAVLNLLAEGNTIPFIARYRKEVTGSLDEVEIKAIEEKYQYANNLAERKEEVLRLIDEQEKLSPELADQIQNSTSLQQVEDLYLPFRQKRRTKATLAKEQGLEPLANWLKTPQTLEPEEKAEEFISAEVQSVEAALAGAHEIIAEEVSDNAQFREFIRKYTRYNGSIVTSLKDESLDSQGVYSQYYDFKEPLVKLLDHRTLAINRAEKEEVINVKIVTETEPIINYMAKRYIPDQLPEPQEKIMRAAIEDAYKRFIGPAIEREMRKEKTDSADKQAIEVFGENLKNLLLQPPMKGQVVMGFDPAYRTGCKLAIVDSTGKVLDKGVIYPHKPASPSQRAKAPKELLELISEYQVDIIAIGNGTASRESEQFVSELIQENNLSTKFIVINEAGASVYSASDIARQEFPDFNVEERSAVSIARRLQDPLAELIKIDPKSMGVGQYQHDVSQKELTEELDFVVNITVNQVGVDINTASIQLLEHVSGLTNSTAKNVINFRNEIGKFTNRKEIKSVKRLGPKTYEQAVGFLRIVGGDNPLDGTSIHPESYKIAEGILKQADLDINSLGQEDTSQRIEAMNPSVIAEKFDIGEETARDILHGLAHPAEDIREGQAAPILRDDVLSMKDLHEGMQLQGVVRNVVDFGAFVDLGVKQDGLIHISKLSKQYIKHPSEVIAVGDIVEVEVISIDLHKERIGLKRLDV